jgi:hypothetical protein
MGQRRSISNRLLVYRDLCSQDTIPLIASLRVKADISRVNMFDTVPATVTDLPAGNVHPRSLLSLSRHIFNTGGIRLGTVDTTFQTVAHVPEPSSALKFIVFPEYW